MPENEEKVTISEVPAEAPVAEAPAFSTTVEDAPMPESAPEPVVEEVPPPAPEPAPARVSTIPVVEQTNAEMEAGRAKVREHEGRERMLKEKRAREASESDQVAAASVNSEL